MGDDMDNSGRLQGKVVMVTGAGSGIGAAVAKRVASDGARVLLLGRRVDKLEETAADVGAAALVQRCDVTDAEDIDNAVALAVDTWGTVDGLVNNAGMFVMAHALEMTREQWHQVLDVDLTAAFFFTQAAGRVMARAGGGSVVNIASVNGHQGEPLNAPYNAAKAGLIGLTRSLAMDLGRLGIRVNSVSPGYVDGTPMADDTGDADVPMSELLRDWQRAPLRRMVDTSEVANLCAFLLSDEASGMTGADVVVDGGMLTNHYALESVTATGWAAYQDSNLAEVRERLSRGEL
jgi:NAD(P)-dependent dehydrogenase (short-subunit alcohol dehydrogenase family)